MEVAKKRWESRVGKKIYVVNEDGNQDKKLNQEKKDRLIPKEIQELLNISAAKCPKKFAHQNT